MEYKESEIITILTKHGYNIQLAKELAPIYAEYLSALNKTLYTNKPH